MSQQVMIYGVHLTDIPDQTDTQRHLLCIATRIASSYMTGEAIEASLVI